jgi:hypothetical protein
MPELLSLDIHSPIDDRPRAVDIFGASVRIGRGPQCEVRLQDAALAEVECLLRRRGTTWYVLPQGMLGNLAIDGRSVEGLMPLGLGMVLRVGEHRLVLRRTQLGPRDIGSFEVPIEIEARGVPTERSEARQRESFERWQSQVAHRDRWLKSRREERRWQAKWKAAGQNLPRQPEPAAAEPIEPPSAEPATVPLPPAPVEKPAASIEIAAEAFELPPPQADDVPPEPVAIEDVPPEPVAIEDAVEVETPKTVEFQAAVEVASEPATETELPFVQPEPPRTEEVSPPEPVREWFAGTHDPFVTDTNQAPRALEAKHSSTVETVDEGWPSVQQILAPSPSPTRRTASIAPSRKASSAPKLSDPIAPATWSVPVWAALVPATLLVLVMGAVGWKLAWTWGQDDRTAGILADRLLRDQSSESNAPIEVPDAPAASWWASTPSHLQLRARAEGSNPSRPESREAVDFLLHTAHNAAPLDSAVRLAMATESEGNTAVRQDPLGSLGLSNDALALRQTGRGRLAAGKIDAGLSAYRQAILMALSIELDRAGMPGFIDDAQVHRFLLPLEETIGDLVRDLDERVPGGYAVWSKAIPDSGVAQLAVYRWLRKRHQPEQDQALDRLSALPECDDPKMEALRLASRAEAEALRESYPSAMKLYQDAIEAMPDDVIGRTWQFNRGEIARLGGDSTTMREAWDAARGRSPHDEINKCLVKAKGRAGLNGRRGTPPDDDSSVVPAPFPLKTSR